MDSSYEIERSKGILKRSFLPWVQIRVRRRILARRSVEKLAKVTKPDVQVLQHIPLFSKWPEQSIGKLLSSSRLEYKQAGMVAAYRGEPRGILCVYWVVSGKLTQVPTKQEVVSCSLDTFGPGVGAGRAVPTGPLIFPALFGGEGDGKAAAGNGYEAPLSQQQEAVLDSLVSYSASQIVDGDSLLLGDLRQRCVRCQTDAVLLAIPLRVLLAELASLKPAVRQGTVASARSAVVVQLAKSAQRPSTTALLERNQVLQALSLRAMKEVWGQLRPYVFSAGDIICTDVFTSSTIYFLDRGHVSIVSRKAGVGSSGGRSVRTLEQRHATGIGLSSFASCELPLDFGEQRSAVAHTYCVLWAAPLSVFIAACDAADEVNCARRATSMLRKLGMSRANMNVAAVLTQVPAFLALSEVSLQIVADVMRLRAHAPGKVIISSSQNTPVKEGLIILCGQCSMVTPATADGKRQGKKEVVTTLRPGLASFFCEALLSRPASVSVRADTSVVALHASPGAVMDALESLSEFELQSVIDGANEYIVSVYGARCGLHEETPQERAAARVKEHEAQQKAAAAKVEGADTPSKAANSTAQSREEAVMENVKVAENNVLTSLYLQLQSLHYDEVTAKRHRFFHDATGSAVKMYDADMKAGHPTATSAARRVKGHFTLDESGLPVFVECGSDSKGEAAAAADGGKLPCSQSSHDVCEPVGVSVAAALLLPPSPPPSLHSKRQRTYPAASEFLASPLPESRPTPARSLQTPFVFHSQDSRHRAPPANVKASGRHPRLAALRQTAEHLKNEADGFDPQAELRRAVAKRSAGV